MAQAAKSFSSGLNSHGEPSAFPQRQSALWLQVAVVYGLIEIALWTPLGGWNTSSIALATVCILCFSWRFRFQLHAMGITFPTVGSAWILLGGAVLAVAIPLSSGVFGGNSGAMHALPFRQSWQYAVWALAQQFILQSFFYARFESLLGSKRAVVVTAVLFGVAHIPSPILTVAGLLGGLFFCEMFRRYRNIFVLGLVHALLGLIVAASFPDVVLHHMRVGIGYLRYHP